MEAEESGNESVVSFRARPTRGRGRGGARGNRPLPYEDYLSKFNPALTVNANIFCSFCACGDSMHQNRIVLCDNCDAPFHQMCHQPVVEDVIAEEPNLPW